MNYIYDILINLKTKIYDFYDWNRKDNILHVRKIPIVKIKSINIFNDEIKINEELLNTICNKSEIYSKLEIKNIPYLCLFCDGIDSIVIEFKNGINYLKSKLLIGENEDVIEFVKGIEYSELDYELIKENKTTFKTRNELEIENYINNELGKINNLNKLKYLYYECFNENCDNKNDMILKNEVKNNWDNIYLKLYEFLKLTTNK